MLATFYTPVPLGAKTRITLAAGAAHHARVKRLRAGEVVQITDGLGLIGCGPIETLNRTDLTITLDRTWTVPRRNQVHLALPVADRDRTLWMAEKATELGVTSWQPVRFHRSLSVATRGDGPKFAAKVRARMIAALEQSGGAWLPEQRSEESLAVYAINSRGCRILLSAQGAPLLDFVQRERGAELSILCGPEGGIEDVEQTALAAAGWQEASLGDATLRFETAGIAAVAVVRAVQSTTGW